MGKLKPGATYIYEKANGITYAREFGAPANERFEIGRDYDRQIQDELELWKEIIQESRNNPVLQKAIEKCKIIYNLSKKEKPLFWHPV
jgi:hypothetical protein